MQQRERAGSLSFVVRIRPTNRLRSTAAASRPLSYFTFRTIPVSSCGSLPSLRLRCSFLAIRRSWRLPEGLPSTLMGWTTCWNRRCIRGHPCEVRASLRWVVQVVRQGSINCGPSPYLLGCISDRRPCRCVFVVPGRRLVIYLDRSCFLFVL